MRSCLLAVVLLALPATAAAQIGADIAEIHTGSRVRVWSDSATQLVKARVFAVAPTGLTVRVTDESTPQVLRFSDLDRVDLSRGRNRLGWTAGGMLAGATAGVIITRLDNSEGDVSGLDGLARGLSNTFSGMLVGGIVGYFVAPERWRTVWRR